MSNLDHFDMLQADVVDFTVDLGNSVISVTRTGLVSNIGKKSSLQLQGKGIYSKISKKDTWIVVCRSTADCEHLVLLGLDLVPRDELDLGHLGKISSLHALNIDGHEYVLCCAGGKLLLCLVSGYVLRDIQTVTGKDVRFISLSVNDEFEGIALTEHGGLWRFKLNSGR